MNHIWFGYQIPEQGIPYQNSMNMNWNYLDKTNDAIPE
jgi:hypothetical protein